MSIFLFDILNFKLHQLLKIIHIPITRIMTKYDILYLPILVTLYVVSKFVCDSSKKAKLD